MEIVRITRVLEYEGPREWVENTLRTSSVPLNGTWSTPRTMGTIKSGIVGAFPTVTATGDEAWAIAHKLHLQDKAEGLPFWQNASCPECTTVAAEDIDHIAVLGEE